MNQNSYNQNLTLEIYDIDYNRDLIIGLLTF